MNIHSIKKELALNIKNLIGWRTDRKIIVISVDDYGNVRLDSKDSRDRMLQKGLKIHNRFDALDTLETRLDLEMLYYCLTSVKDKYGKHAVFTAFALPCNINFEKMAETNYKKYHYELLPKTFRKLSIQQTKAYEGAWNLWQEGIKRKLLVPMFHGREHLNLKVLEEKLAKEENEVLTVLRNRSYTSISSSGYNTISPMAAFDFWSFSENERFHQIIEDGLNAFEKVFGYRAVHFNPPGGREHPIIHKTLKECGIRYIDTPLLKREHQGKGKHKTKFNYTGKRNKHQQMYLVRNVLFEPTQDRGIDWVNYATQQIEAAFRWNRPAIISSHRVNFCGHIDPENRAKGLGALRELLQRIVQRWPEVEFMAANELADLIASEQ